MAISVVMPALEMAQETGKIVSWRKKEGERVSKGETLLEIETDKAVVEIEAMGEGILAGVTAKEGDVIPVGQTIGWLVQPGEAPPKDVAPTQTGRRSDSAVVGAPAAAPAAVAEPASGRARISPKARRLAREHGIETAGIRGSGPEGAIEEADILAAVESRKSSTVSSAPASAAASSASAEATGSIWRLMAARTTQSWTTVPHFFVTREVDAGALVAAREKLAAESEKSGGAKPTISDVLVALVARALKKHPRMNASWSSEGIRGNAEVNIGLAMAVSDGVVSLVIRNADATPVAQIAARRRELTERAKAGKIQPGDIAGATFTISNLGMYEVDAFTAIVVPPQAGILAVGAITNRVVPLDGADKIGVRPMLALTLSCDHRVVDGARGAEFLKDVAEGIREAEKLVS